VKNRIRKKKGARYFSISINILDKRRLKIYIQGKIIISPEANI